MKKFLSLFLTPVILATFLTAVISTAETDTAQNIGIKAVLAEDASSFIIKEDGSLWGWGLDHWGQLGDDLDWGKPEWDPSVNRLSPIKILDNVQSVVGNGDHNYEGGPYTMAVKKDGSLWIWGDTGYAGDGGNYALTAPPIKILDNVKEASAGLAHRLALKDDGTLWAWGYNGDGQLGDGTQTDRSVPVKVMDHVKAIGTGWYESYVIMEDDSLWQLKTTSVKIMDDVVSVVGSNFHSFALKKDGSLWGWGDNLYFSLGDGTEEYREEPVKIMDDVKFVTSGGNHSLAIKKDGSLWTWGSDHSVRLRHDVSEQEKFPVKIMDNVITASISESHALAIREDGSIWAWGDNSHGQLGDGTTTSSSTPIKIYDGVSVSAKPTTSKVMVDGKVISFEAYGIKGYNYFKLRDLAVVLSGTDKQFEVDWDGSKNAINLTKNMPYTSVGGELSLSSGSAAVSATPTTSKVYVDGEEVSFIAYSIGGNNYFKLRDIARVIDFGVNWDGASNTIVIDTSIPYTE